ncbi:MAG: LamG-like jellyroll fold domain-containing protein [Saprospiraceae bacterium]
MVQGQSVKTIENMVEVLDDACLPEINPSLALDLNGTDGSVAFGATGVATNEWTTTAWIKRRSPQNDWGGIVFCRGGNTVAGLSIRSSGDLGYHWNNSGWSWSSNLNVPEGEWVYVAMRVTPDSVTLMMNDQMATHVTSNRSRKSLMDHGI